MRADGGTVWCVPFCFSAERSAASAVLLQGGRVGCISQIPNASHSISRASTAIQVSFVCEWKSGWKWKGWKLFFSWSSSRSEFEFLLTSFSEFLHWNNLIIAYIFKRHYSFRHPEQMSRQISCSVSETFKPTDAFCCSEGLIFPPL